MLATPVTLPSTLPPSSSTPSPHQQTNAYHSSRPSTSSLPRSYKRAKSTPSPHSPSFPTLPISSESGGQAGPSRSKPRATVARRLVEPSPHSWRSDASRRREMSVPLLSQELSHFSLSHSSPPEMCCEADSITPPITAQRFFASPPQGSRTPRSRSHIGPSKTPVLAALPKDHTYPSTAPLPQLSSLLGSPFSTKTARGRYVYHNVSPSQQATKATMTERIGLGRESFDEPGLEWLESTEGLPVQTRRGSREAKLPLLDGLPHPPSSRMRRGTNGSTSSMDELSGSGASTASLLSLARSSMDHHSRPNIITVWDEESHGLEEEEEESSRTSRQLFAKSDSNLSLHMPTKVNRASVRPFSLHTKKAAHSAVPQTIREPFSRTMSLPESPIPQSSCKDDIHPSPEKPIRSPLSGFLPRLLSSKKKNSQTFRKVSPGTRLREDEDIMTDTEDSTSLKGSLRGKTKNLWDKTKALSSRNAMEGGDHEPSLGVGIGLGIRRGPFGSSLRAGTEKCVDLARSLSSDSTGSIETSPSRPLSNRGSTSLLVKPTLPSSPSSAALSVKPQSKSAFLARRKSVNGQLPNSTAGSPATASANASRPAKARPLLRRGITAPAHSPYNASLLSADSAFHTPTHVLFGDVRPSPSAFASTGLVKKKSGIHGIQIPKFGGVDSEPVGEIKRDQAAAQHGMTRTIEPPSPVSPIKPFRFTRPAINTSLARTGSSSTSTSNSTITSTVTTNSSNAAYIQAAQKTRGLRRKGSQMFTASGSIGSMDMMRSDSNRSARGAISPSTPTKPGLQITPIGLGVTTPSPIGQHHLYPFASSSGLISTPPHSSIYAPSEPIEPSSLEKYRNMPARIRQISNSHASERGPIARASNPMLATAFKASASIHTVVETRGQGQMPSLNLFNENSRSAHNTGVAKTRLDKDFTVVQALGSGAFSQVLEVCEKSSGKLYAVKAGKPYTGAKNRLRQLEEVSILRQLSLSPHPNVVAYIDSWETRSRLYIRTTLSECGDLSKFLGLLGDFGGLGEDRVWKSLVELSSGLSHIHQNNFLHLDIKPSNILINRDGGLVIADLGMAVICSPDSEGKVLGGLSPALPGKDDNGEFVWTNTQNNDTPREEKSLMDIIPSPILDREVEGDREYLCPEALNDDKNNIGKGADIFSLGMVILESAVNVVLPSNGEGWIKLRNNDFSDLDEHYRLRSTPTTYKNNQEAHNNDGDPTIPSISNEMILVIKGMMQADPSRRWTLNDIWNNKVVKKIMAKERGKALVEEGSRWLEEILRA
ncbi:uncharacterized protein IL334_005631 [Kwoniella shivajii]|uniref:Protein kinase domain-containing protein n=1 Tax=Kwoniella shivajii TaxID=564305 RepID=A0ABZ1D7M9_9TREE|nr:hypothetical protein IL334_005631 [Kwoniella shivajii]